MRPDGNAGAGAECGHRATTRGGMEWEKTILYRLRPATSVLPNSAHFPLSDLSHTVIDFAAYSRTREDVPLIVAAGTWLRECEILARPGAGGMGEVNRYIFDGEQTWVTRTEDSIVVPF